MSKRVPSGCEKRKKKKEEQEKILKLSKINSFFSSAVPYEENTINSNITQPNTKPTALNDTTLNIIESFTTEPEHSSSKGKMNFYKLLIPNVEPSITLNDTTSDKSDIIETFTPEPALIKQISISIFSLLFIDLDLTCRYPSDRGKFSDKVLDAQTKRLIMSFGPCKPDINFPRNDSNRKFSIEYYFMNTKSGFKIPRTWLCYSIILDMVYCETCWLFADRLNKNYYSNWVDGVNDWQHLAQKISKHESSTQHIEAVQVRSLWNKNKIIDEQLERQISEEADFWRNVLERIIKIILFLTTGNTALRGKEGKFGDCNKFAEGNILRTVRLLADYDPVLNKLIINYEEHKFEIKESFIGFYELKHHTAKDYEQLIRKIIIKLNLDITKCRGQGYDGASVMSGKHNGVQTRVKYIVPSATFVHCCSHNLNLVISDAAKSHQKIINFFDTVQAIFNFFSSSGPRWALLAFKSDISNEIRAKVLKKVCPTSSKTNEKNLAVGLKKQIENREFVLILCLWEPILRALQGISKPLQNVNITLDQASNMLPNAVQTTQKLRNSFEDILKNANELCLKWGISTSFFNKRNIFAKKHYDELDGDYRLNDITSDFARQLIALKTVIINSEIKTIKDLAQFIISNSLPSSFPDILSACIIFMCIPVTVVSAERSFSKLKLIKNYLRNTCNQDRLSSLAVLNIEREQTINIAIEKIINDFANAKSRRKNFLI
ncbi:hypothetical protein QTP88_017861 [Uroleucon formosanum]